MKHKSSECLCLAMNRLDISQWFHLLNYGLLCFTLAIHFKCHIKLFWAYSKNCPVVILRLEITVSAVLIESVSGIT